MGCLAEFFFELVGELVGEAFISLSEVFIPEKKLSKKKRKVIRACSCAFAAVLFLADIIGVAVLVESKCKIFWGWLPLIISFVYIAAAVYITIKRR